MKKNKDSQNMPQKNAETDVPQHSDELAALTQKLEALAKEKDDLFQQLQRLSADYANFQKRTPRQIADSVAYEKEAFIRSLLPALDNFDQARASFDKNMSLEAMRKGIEILYSHLLDILKSQGVEQIEAAGKPFDPSLHQAIMQKEDPAQDASIILEEYQKGYKFGDRIIRPSRVIVNKISSQPPPDINDETTDVQ
ncbi:MAG TPA: nucleotide exchange factor GrpE [Sedimentisphaerales bacterium]|nr:nucleotide exchange factor GrpE [Sedimentisphaerales bacterium]